MSVKKKHHTLAWVIAFCAGIVFESVSAQSPDFKVAANGGDISGATLSAQLNIGDVTISSVNGATQGNGDVYIDDVVHWWSSHTLTIVAERNIYVRNHLISAGNNSGLILSHGITGDYRLVGGRVQLSGRNPILKIGISGQEDVYQIINIVGTQAGPGSLNPNALQAMVWKLGGFFALGRDLDATGTSVLPIGSDARNAVFSGRFIGLNNTIRGLTIDGTNRGNWTGLFGVTSSTSVIRDLHLTELTVRNDRPPSSVDVGGLVGANAGTIRNVSVDGNISSLDNSGGITGRNFGSIIESSSRANAVGLRSGGLVGLNGGAISNSYATGTSNAAVINQYSYAGGLVGVNSGSILNSFSTGRVLGRAFGLAGGLTGASTSSATVVSSYWDVETSMISLSSSGSGKTTAELLRRETFVGWPFNEVWRITQDATYPLFFNIESPEPATEAFCNGWQSSNPTRAYAVSAVSGTVLDTRTMLLWDQCPFGLSGANCNTGTRSGYSFDSANALPNSLTTYKGASGWRIPTAEELQTLLETCRSQPTLNTTVFPNAISSGVGGLTAYWSGQFLAADPGQARYVSFGDGSDNYLPKTSLFMVRLVNDSSTRGTFTVTPSAGANGTINPNTAQSVNSGTTKTFSATPNAGYTSTWGGTCGGTPSGNSYTTNAVTANCTVTVNFTASPVNGQCGVAGGRATAIMPVNADLCAAGTASTVTGTAPGPWSWTCNGLNSGTNASCTAPAGVLAQLRISQGGVPISAVTAFGDGHTGAVDSTVFERLGALAIDCTLGSCPFTVSSDKSWLRIGIETATGNITMGQTGSGSTPRGVFYEIDPTANVSDEVATLTFSSGPNSQRVNIARNGLRDYDDDGVPDEWELRGFPRSDGTRGSLGGTFLKNGKIEFNNSAPYGHVVYSRPSSDAERIVANRARDIWLWIDEMQGVPESSRLQEDDLKKIGEQFDRHGITLRWLRAPIVNWLPDEVIDYENTSLANAIDRLKNVRFSSGIDSLRDVIYRWALVGNRTRCLGEEITYGRAPIFGLQRNALVTTLGGCADGSSRKTGHKARTLNFMHELGHVLGLGHGGPRYEALTNFKADPTYKWAISSADTNYKPNHVSIMNYSFLNVTSGLAMTDKSRWLDYSAVSRDYIDETNLVDFWKYPLKVGGVADATAGSVYYCGDKAVKFDAGDSNISCGLWGNRPPMASVNKDAAINGYASYSEWDRLIFNLPNRIIDGVRAIELNVSNVAANRFLPLIDDHEEPVPKSGTQLSVNDDVRVEVIAPLTTKYSAKPNTQLTVLLLIENRGLKQDTFKLELKEEFDSNQQSRQQISVIIPSVTLAPNTKQYIEANISVPISSILGEIRRITFKAVGAANESNTDFVSFLVHIVDSSDRVSIAPTAPAEDLTSNLFTITGLIGVKPDIYVESGSVTLTGFDVPLPIQVRGGEMSINGGGWTQYISTVNPGDTLRLRAVSSTVAGEKRTVEVAVGGLVRAFDVTTSLDTDGDGIPDAVETAGPNNGDANGDGIPDSTQPNIGTIFSPAGNGYVTFEVSGGCSVAQAISMYTEAQMASQDANYAYPLGLLGFRLPCTSATVKLYYHGVTSLSGYTFRRYGPTTPGNTATSAWSNVPNVTTGTKVIGGATVATASYSLTDGQPGDDTATDGAIVDPVGPALYVGGPVDANGVPVPVNDRSGLVVLMAMMVLAGGFAYRRRSHRIPSEPKG
jgi:hypothetical protein